MPPLQPSVLGRLLLTAPVTHVDVLTEDLKSDAASLLSLLKPNKLDYIPVVYQLTVDLRQPFDTSH